MNLDHLIIASPVISVMFPITGIFAMTYSNLAQGRDIDTISEMLVQSSSFYQAFIPFAFNYATSWLIMQIGYKHLLKYQKMSCYSDHKKIFFAFSYLERLVYSYLQSTMAVSLIESTVGHFLYGCIFFSLYPILLLLEWYIYRKNIVHLLHDTPNIESFFSNLKLISIGLSLLGVACLITMLPKFFIKNNDKLERRLNYLFVVGEFLYLFSMISRSIELSTDLYILHYVL